MTMKKLLTIGVFAIVTMSFAQADSGKPTLSIDDLTLVKVKCDRYGCHKAKRHHFRHHHRYHHHDCYGRAHAWGCHYYCKMHPYACR